MIQFIFQHYEFTYLPLQHKQDVAQDQFLSGI